MTFVDLRMPVLGSPRAVLDVMLNQRVLIQCTHDDRVRVDTAVPVSNAEVLQDLLIGQRIQFATRCLHHILPKDLAVFHGSVRVNQFIVEDIVIHVFMFDHGWLDTSFYIERISTISVSLYVCSICTVWGGLWTTV